MFALTICMWILSVEMHYAYSDDKLLPTKFLEVENLNGLSSFKSVYEEIFTPNYVNTEGTLHKHNIHVTDKLGNYIKLDYEAKHPSNVEIIKMDQNMHKVNVESLKCKYDEHNTVELFFKSPKIAMEYFANVQSTLSFRHDRNKAHFITASHEWGCVNKTSGKYESLLRRITNVRIDELTKTKLVLSTETAGLVDIFEELNLELNTNIGMHSPNNNAVTQRRKTLGWYEYASETLLPALEDGITAVYDEVVETVETVSNTVQKVVAYAMGDPVDFSDSKTYSWQWNYDPNTGKAVNTIDFPNQNGDDTDGDVQCINCYSYMNLNYNYQLTIDDYTIKTLEMYMEGTVKINIGIDGTSNLTKSITIPAGAKPIPDFGVTVAGFTFGVFIRGEIEIGVRLSIDSFAFQFDASGHVKKGMVYNADAGRQDYINENDFSYNKQGPKMNFQTANIILYAQPTIYLTLEHVGAVYFGIQPRVNLDYDRPTDLSGSCAYYCTPSLSLNAFVGVKISTLGFSWNKDLKLEAIQPTISSWGGCVDQAKVTQIQTYQQPYSYEGYGDYYYDYYGNYSGNYSYYHRRRMVGDVTDISGNTLVDISGISLDAYRSVKGWGNVNTKWWANMSTIPDICNDWSYAFQGSSALPILTPTNATLMVKVIDNETMIGVYHTFIEVTPHSGWNFLNVETYTNVSCATRERFTLQTMNEHDDIPTYDVQMLEWYCDTNLSHLGIVESDDSHFLPWIWMISLPSTLNAIQLDASFGNIMLFDATWCSVFSLTKKPKYTLNDTKIQNIDWNTFQYPVRLWYGSWNCHDNVSTNAEIYFIGLNHSTGTVDGILTLNSNSNYSNSYFLSGNVDILNMTMKLDIFWDNYATNLTMVGLLHILYDGSMTFSGSIDSTGCTGFLFQGYFNVSQFDDIETVSNETINDIGDKTEQSAAQNVFPTEGAIGFVIGLFTSLMVIAVIFVACKCKNKKMTPDEQKMTEMMNSAGTKVVAKDYHDQLMTDQL